MVCWCRKSEDVVRWPKMILENQGKIAKKIYEDFRFTLFFQLLWKLLDFYLICRNLKIKNLTDYIIAAIRKGNPNAKESLKGYLIFPMHWYFRHASANDFIIHFNHINLLSRSQLWSPLNVLYVTSLPFSTMVSWFLMLFSQKSSRNYMIAVFSCKNYCI